MKKGEEKNMNIYERTSIVTESQDREAEQLEENLVKEDNNCKVRSELEKFIGSSMGEIVSLYGNNRSNKFFKNGEGWYSLNERKKMYILVAEIFAKVNKIYENYPKNYEQILGGEFLVIAGMRLPLFAILELFLLICKNSSLPMNENTNIDFYKVLEDILSETRKLEVSSNFDTSWHINPSAVLQIEYGGINIFGTHTGEVLKSFPVGYNERNGTRKRENRRVISLMDCYWKLIKGYDDIWSNFDPKQADITSEEYEILKFLYYYGDLNRIPELEYKTGILMLGVEMERFGKIGGRTETLKQEAILFQEQKTDLEEKYLQLLEIGRREKKNLEDEKKEIYKRECRKYIIPYFKDLDSMEGPNLVELPWDKSDYLKKIKEQLVNFWNDYQAYRIEKNQQSGNSKLEPVTVNDFLDSDYYRYSTVYTTIVDDYEKEEKRGLVDNLVKQYASISPFIKKAFGIRGHSVEELTNYLTRLSLMELYSLNSTSMWNQTLYFRKGKFGSEEDSPKKHVKTIR